ncbi:hypothetical protein HDU96_008975 [Phlyctochytrium bullatum]|nr:hypothetical protein HDU96_008975 [Phlyctochytrium bullatum]
MIRLLISYGADVNGGRGTGFTSPLHAAAERNRIECAALLLKEGADYDYVDMSRRTPLKVALDKNNLSIAKMLALAGATKLVGKENGEWEELDEGLRDRLLF